MATVIIENTDRYRFDSIGNGAAYELYEKATGQTRFVQYGDDATAWRGTYDAMVTAAADPASPWYYEPWNCCLAHLFDVA
jgi:hypothetical protein